MHDVHVLAHLFFKSAHQQPIHSQSTVLKAIKTDDPRTECEKVFDLIQNFENKDYPTIKNIVACCLINHILLEQKADAKILEAVEYCIDKITHTTYLPVMDKKRFLRSLTHLNNRKCLMSLQTAKKL